MRAWLMSVVVSLLFMSAFVALGYGLATLLTDVEGHAQSRNRTNG
jgi:hypothetical protein